MAKRISELPVVNSPQASDRVLINHDGVTSTVPVSAFHQEEETDESPIEGSTNLVTSGGVYEALSEVQESLVFDDEPLEGSGNPVKSGGIKAALDGKQDLLSYVPETDEVKVSDYIFLERGGTIFKCLTEKILLFSDLLVTESGDALLTEDGEVLMFDGIS